MSEQQAGFEFDGHFYPWKITYSTGKDLMLIDRLTGMTLQQFLDVVETGQIPLSFRLVMVATSIRHEQPDWTVARIVRTVEEMDFDRDFVELGGEEEDESPPTTEPAAETPSGEPSRSPPTASSPPSTPRDNSRSETSSEIPV